MDPNSKDLTLKQYVDMRLASYQRETDIRFSALEREMNLELRSSTIAVDKANDAMTHRLESLNNFREQLGDQVKTFATRNEVESLRESHEEQLRGLARQVYLLVGAMAVIEAVVVYLLN